MIHPTITFVSPLSSNKQTTCECADRLASELSIELEQVDTVSELFPLLSNPDYHTTIISIDVERLINRKDGLDILDIINTLSTLIKCTVERTGGGRPIKRATKICVLISDQSDPKLVRQLMLMPDIFLGTLMSGTWTYEMVRDNIARNLAGDFSVPKHVLELVKPKRGSIVRKLTIELTPREQQILQLIQDRGASNKVIAKMLSISESTVKLHIGKVLKKYGCKNRTQLALFSKRSAEV